MTDKPDKPELYQHRLLEKGGKQALAYDFARKQGQPVAVTGPNAIECPQCGAKISQQCGGITGKDDYAHFSRIVVMNKKIKELSGE